MIYLDYAATTPDLTDYNSIGEVIKHYYGNPSSAHIKGIEARGLVEDARQKIAEYLGCTSNTLTFTSGATEANNMVIKGWVKHQGYPSEILYSPTAHHSMTRPVEELAGQPLTVHQSGMIDEDVLEELLLEYYKNHMSVLVCFEWVNNETGIIQRAKELVALCHKYNAEVLIDAVQALPVIHISLDSLGADYVTFSAHKIYGPKGIGLMYARNPFNLYPMITGGSQEYGLRAGTENVVGILGFQSAIARLSNRMWDDWSSSYELTKTLLKVLAANMVDFKVNGADNLSRSPAILNLNCKVEGSALAQALSNEGYLVSTGAACDGREERSHVLMAMGLEEASTTSIRISVSAHLTTKGDIEKFGLTLIKCIKELQV